MRAHVLRFDPHGIQQLVETDQFAFHLCGERDPRQGQADDEQSEISNLAMASKMGVIGHWNDRTRPNGHV
jgi:hypothetical protein